MSANHGGPKQGRTKTKTPSAPPVGLVGRRKNSRRKGAAGERELSEILRAAGYQGARRGQQRSGLDQADVIGGPASWHLECKRVEALNVWAAFAQAERDRPPGSRAAVVMRRNGTRWLVVLALDDWLPLVARDEREREANDFLAKFLRPDV